MRTILAAVHDGDLARDGRICAALSEQADQDHRAVSGGRRSRHADTRDLRACASGARTTVDHREPDGGKRRARPAGLRAVGARRLHLLPGHRRSAVGHAALRSETRRALQVAHSRDAVRRRRRRDLCAPVAQGEHAARRRRVREGASDGAELLVVGARHLAASVVRVAEEDQQHRNPARAAQGLGGGRAGGGRRAACRSPTSRSGS